MLTSTIDELFDADVKLVLDIHAPLAPVTGRCRRLAVGSTIDYRQHSDEARCAKLNSVEDMNGDTNGLVYSWTDRPTTQLARCTRESILNLKSRADGSVVKQLTCDYLTLHAREHSQVGVADSQWAARCQFFVDKVSQIRDNITETIRTSASACIALYYRIRRKKKRGATHQI